MFGQTKGISPPFYNSLALIGTNALLPLKFHDTKGEEQGNRCPYDAFEQLVNNWKPCKWKRASVGDILSCQRALMGT